MKTIEQINISVSDSIWKSIGVPIGRFVYDSIGNSGSFSVGDDVKNYVENIVDNNVRASVYYNVIIKAREFSK